MDMDYGGGLRERGGYLHILAPHLITFKVGQWHQLKVVIRQNLEEGQSWNTSMPGTSLLISSFISHLVGSGFSYSLCQYQLDEMIIYYLLSLEIRSNANIRVRDHVSLIWKNTEDVTGSKQILAVRIMVFKKARWKWESLLLTIHYDRNSAP